MNLKIVQTAASFSTEARMASTNTIILKETIEQLNALL
jgi:hypothetical protein